MMNEISRRGVLAAAAAAGTAGVVGCSSSHHAAARPRSQDIAHKKPSGSASPSPRKKVRLIGDGSTSDTGPQPNQPKPERLKPGERPPQFVVFSWDGAGVAKVNLFQRFRELAKQHGVAMTFFLSGLYVLPESKRKMYHPPHHPAGSSEIEFLTDHHIHETLQQLTLAWNEGSEVGTHYNGHFCGPHGVGQWSSSDWRSEIDQAVSFVMHWKTNTGFTDLPALPFDYRKELIGSRTPCLEGRKNMLPVAADLGWRYDASSPGGMQMWPGKIHGLWDFPLQSIPFEGHDFQVLSMDYNMLANQSGTPKGDKSKFPTWRKQAADTYMNGFHRAYTTNRAPYFIGNHFEQWNGGIYMDAVEDAFKQIVGQPDVRIVSFKQMSDWLDAQDPAVLSKLRRLDPGQKPEGGWADFLGTAASEKATAGVGAA